MGRRRRAPKAAATPDAASEFVGTGEAAVTLGVSPATLRRWVSEGRVPARKVGKQWRIRRSDLGSVVMLRDAQPAAPVPPVDGMVEQCERQIDGLLAGLGMSKTAIKEAGQAVESQITQPYEGDAEVRRLLFKLLLHAVRSRASDLHIEPSAGPARVRQRVDGLLTEAAELPQGFARLLVDEIKRLVKLDPNERRRAQDGCLMAQLDGRDIDFRINVTPGVHGEVAALRILDRGVMLLTLDRLGLEADQLDRYRAIVERPNGLILTTGPTGNGVTTTIYASLAHLNAPQRKIMTAEDPVEYVIAGVDQAEINEDIGFGYAQAARAMMRQAADVLFIGELRDRETAEVAVAAALTGHLVFSTMHTNDAPGAVSRLLDIGVKPYRLASAFQAIFGQRLVRLICRHCRTRYEPSDEELHALELTDRQPDGTFWRGAGCAKCHRTGYRGRAAVYQVLEFTSEVRRAVFEERSTADIRETARSAGLRTLREVALDKVFRGETTLAEVATVIG